MADKRIFELLDHNGDLAGFYVPIDKDGEQQAVKIPVTDFMQNVLVQSIEDIDLKPTGNDNEFTVEITWLDADGNEQTTTDPTPITVSGGSSQLPIKPLETGLGDTHNNGANELAVNTHYIIVNEDNPVEIIKLPECVEGDRLIITEAFDDAQWSAEPINTGVKFIAQSFQGGADSTSSVWDLDDLNNGFLVNFYNSEGNRRRYEFVCLQDNYWYLLPMQVPTNGVDGQDGADGQDGQDGANGLDGDGLQLDSVKSTNFTAGFGKMYPIDTSSGSFYCNIDSNAQPGDKFGITDARRAFGTNPFTVRFTSSSYRFCGNNSGGDVQINKPDKGIIFVFVSVTYGWMIYSGTL